MIAGKIKNARTMHEHFGLDARWFNYHELKGWYKTILRYL